MKKNLLAKACAVLMAASVTLALAACGSSDSSREGTVSLGPSDASGAAESAAAESKAESAAEESKAESAAEESKAAEENAPAAESAASEERTPEVAADAPFAEKFRFRYNGADFYVGEKFADIKDKLGKEAKPSAASKPCVPGAQDITFYYYPGLTIQVNFEGTVIEIALGEENAPGRDASTAGGLKLGDSIETAKKFLGEPAVQDEYHIEYTEGTASVSIYGRENEGIFIITLSDSSLPF